MAGSNLGKWAKARGGGRSTPMERANAASAKAEKSGSIEDHKAAYNANRDAADHLVNESKKVPSSDKGTWANPKGDKKLELRKAAQAHQEQANQHLTAIAAGSKSGDDHPRDERGRFTSK